MSDVLPFYNIPLETLDPPVDLNNDDLIINELNINQAIWSPFSKHGLHFLHININSILPKIEELRQIAKLSDASIIGISESKLDETVLEGEICIDGYKLIRADRNRIGGGVACYIKSDLAFNQRKDFSTDIENIFFDILLPNSKPILVGIIYRPPDQSGFLNNLADAINGTEKFDEQEVYILGDFNINLLHKETLRKNYPKYYKEFCSAYGLKQLITSPTRITQNTSTLLDHILTNSSDRTSQSGTVEIGISDHLLTYCTRKITRTKFHDHKYIRIRSLKNYTQEKYIQTLKEINFPDYTKFNSVNEAYDDLIAKLTEVIDKLAPIKEVRIKNNTQEWFDDEIHSAIQNRDKRFSVFKRSRLCEDKLAFKRAQNNVQNLIKKKKKQYIKNKLDENLGKPKELWKTLKSLGLSETKASGSKIGLAKKKDEISFDPKENSEIFKDFFANLASNLVSKLPPAPMKFGMNTVEAYYKNRISPKKDFSFSSTNESNILDLLKNINPSKAAGLDNIAGKFLKEGATILAMPLTQICNLSIASSSFPDKCKHAKLKPLFKKGPTTEPKNYRPISLLPLVSKIIEKVIHDQTIKYLDENNIIYKYQSGFRSNHSTNSCLSYLCNKVQQGFEKGMLTGMILIDLQKAFDTIDHEIFLKKMRYLGFSDSAINWFKSYLENRTFSVQVEDSLSSLGDLKCGVPQGSILGPLLFLLYVNDMSQAVTCDLLLYADDSCLVFQGGKYK